MNNQMTTTESLWDQVRATKLQLIRSTRQLLLALEEEGSSRPEDRQLQHQVAVVSRRFEQLQEEMADDLSFIKKEIKTGYSILEKALNDKQLQQEMKVFETRGNNADKILDLNFRIQEIESSIGRR